MLWCALERILLYYSASTERELLFALITLSYQSCLYVQSHVFLTRLDSTPISLPLYRTLHSNNNEYFPFYPFEIWLGLFSLSFSSSFIFFFVIIIINAIISIYITMCVYIENALLRHSFEDVCASFILELTWVCVWADESKQIGDMIKEIRTL